MNNSRVICNSIIPEGREVCPLCGRQVNRSVQGNKRRDIPCRLKEAQTGISNYLIDK